MTSVTTQPGGSGGSSENVDTTTQQSGARGEAQTLQMNQQQIRALTGHRNIEMAPFVPSQTPMKRDELGGSGNEFCCRLRYFCIDQEDKFDALTIYGGSEIRELLENLVLEDAEANNTGNFDDAIKKIDEYFDPLVNKDSARNKFGNMSQNQGESVAEYHVRLNSQAHKCQFADC